MADKYCSAQFKTGEELDAALKAALDTCDYSVAASECRQAAEKHKTEAGVSEHNAEVYAEGGKLEAHEGQTVSPEEIPGAKGYMTEARSHMFVAGIQAENAKAYAEGGIPQQDVGDGWFVGGMPTLGAKGYVDQAKVYAEGGEAPMTPPELGDGVVRSHGAKNFANMAAAYAIGGSFNQYMPEHGGMVSTTVDKGAMQYAEEARLAAEQTKKDVQDASNSADEAENFAIEARKMYMNAADAYSGAAAASGWAKSYKDEAAESAAAAAKSAEEAKNAAASGGGGSGGGGSGSGDCDWNIMKNKPFYSEKMALVDTTLEVDPDSCEGALIDPIGLIAGQEYTVTWNGTEYACTAQGFDVLGMGIPSPVLGNLGALLGGEGTGEPFIIVELPPEGVAAMGVSAILAALDGSASVTLVIAGEITKTIDPKFLPKSLQFGSEQREKVLFEQTLDYSSATLVNLSQRTNLVAGETYNVYWNGVKCKCVAQYADLDDKTSLVGLGNQSLQNKDYGFMSNEEPFFIVVLTFNKGLDSEYCQTSIWGSESGVTVEAKIEQDYEHVEKVDPKYLPDGIPSVEHHDEVIMAETYVEGSGGMAYINTPIGEIVADGRYYHVVFNGKTYSCKAMPGSDETAVAHIGRDRTDGAGSEGYDVPFKINVASPAAAAAAGATATVMLYGDNTSCTIGINGWYKIHKMDERCLPEIPRVFWVEFDRKYVSNDIGSIFTPNVTINEVYAAYLKNCLIVGRDALHIYMASSVSTTQVIFQSIQMDTNGFLGADLLIWSNGNVREIQSSTTMSVTYDKTNPYET